MTKGKNAEIGQLLQSTRRYGWDVAIYEYTRRRINANKRIFEVGKGLRHTGTALLAVILLAANGGCDLRTLRPGHLLSLGAGWLLGQSTVAATMERYLNGEPIDCANVPD